MEKCDTYYRRRQLTKTYEFPSITEIMKRHQTNLAQILFNYATPDSKSDIGLISVLNGARDDLWVSPSDLLIPKVALKPPLTSKYVRALTHQGILEIGRNLQLKYQNDLQRQTEAEIELLAEKLKLLYSKEIMKAIAAEKFKAAKEAEIEKKRADMECKKKIQAALEELQQRLCLECELRLHSQKIDLLSDIEQRIYEAEIAKTNALEEAFQKELEDIDRKHLEALAETIRQGEVKLEKALDEAQTEKEETIRLLRHDLECRNMANVMYILTAERNRFEEEKESLTDEFRITLDSMACSSLDLYNRILDLEKEAEIQRKKIADWEQRALYIGNEFQKFITYTLNASPTQAEYLLNLQDFLCEHIESKKIDVPQEKLAMTKAPKARDDNLLDPDKRCHKIENKIVEPDPDTPDDKSHLTLASGEGLPKFMYNKHMYVREDFRNSHAVMELPKGPIIWDKKQPQKQINDDFRPANYDAIKNQTEHRFSSAVRFVIKNKPEFPTTVTESEHSESIPGDILPLVLRSPAYGGLFDPHLFMNDPATWDQSSARFDINEQRHSKDKSGSVIRPSYIRSSLRPPSKARFSNLLDQAELPKVSSFEVLRDNVKKPSKLLTARNSLILHQGKLSTIHVLESDSDSKSSKPLSKINLARDSVEMFKERESIKNVPFNEIEFVSSPDKVRPSIIKSERKSSDETKSSRRPTIDETANKTFRNSPERSSKVKIKEEPVNIVTTIDCSRERDPTIDDLMVFDKLEVIDKVSEVSCRNFYYPEFHKRITSKKERPTNKSDKSIQRRIIVGSVENEECTTPAEFMASRIKVMKTIRRKDPKLLQFSKNQKL